MWRLCATVYLTIVIIACERDWTSLVVGSSVITSMNSDVLPATQLSVHDTRSNAGPDPTSLNWTSASSLSNRLAFSSVFIGTLATPIATRSTVSDLTSRMNCSACISPVWQAGVDHDAGRRRRCPQVIIIGAKKAGTRALLEFLRVHPNIRAVGPEVHFFDKNYHRGFEWYR